MNNPETLANKR